MTNEATAKKKPWRLRSEIVFAWMNKHRTAHIRQQTKEVKEPYKEPRLPKRTK